MRRCVSVFITFMNIILHSSLQNQFSESVTVCDRTRVCSHCFLTSYGWKLLSEDAVNFISHST